MTIIVHSHAKPYAAESVKSFDPSKIVQLLLVTTINE